MCLVSLYFSIPYQKHIKTDGYCALEVRSEIMPLYIDIFIFMPIYNIDNIKGLIMKMYSFFILAASILIAQSVSASNTSQSAVDDEIMR